MLVYFVTRLLVVYFFTKVHIFFISSDITIKLKARERFPTAAMFTINYLTKVAYSFKSNTINISRAIK
jgi:hypothetical protein